MILLRHVRSDPAQTSCPSLEKWRIPNSYFLPWLHRSSADMSPQALCPHHLVCFFLNLIHLKPAAVGEWASATTRCCNYGHDTISSQQKERNVSSLKRCFSGRLTERRRQAVTEPTTYKNTKVSISVNSMWKSVNQAESCCLHQKDTAWSIDATLAASPYP